MHDAVPDAVERGLPTDVSGEPHVQCLDHTLTPRSRDGAVGEHLAVRIGHEQMRCAMQGLDLPVQAGIEPAILARVVDRELEAR